MSDFLRDWHAEPDDRRRLTLVVQGGGMRGVYSMGALSALEAAGLRSAFDLIVASSAGAINAAYMLAGQASEAVDVYVELLSSRKFANLARLGKVVDIDYLVDVALKSYQPLDVDAVRQSSTLLEIVLTDAETARPVIVTNRDQELDLYEVIRATAALPGFYNRVVRLDGGMYVDGGIADAVPLLRAVEGGGDPVLVVLTRLPSFRRTDQGAVFRWVTRRWARGQSAAVKGLMGRADPRFNSTMDILEDKVNPPVEFEHWYIAPSNSEQLVGRTTRDKGKLRACADMGRRDMEMFLSGPGFLERSRLSP